ncbi:hypothetical protein [Microbacterium sp.]|uniref:hypothetical protein n=1 Tax=Microbacterium sp. TaxID=51671 RepID=UPI002812573A|nr:hypothetical protein [Microbacterium sp.]
MTNPHLTPLLEAIARLERAWADAGGADDLSRQQLIAASEGVGVLRRRVDGLHAEIAASIAHESRAELGPDSLAKQQGSAIPPG